MPNKPTLYKCNSPYPTEHCAACVHHEPHQHIKYLFDKFCNTERRWCVFGHACVKCEPVPEQPEKPTSKPILLKIDPSCYDSTTLAQMSRLLSCLRRTGFSASLAQDMTLSITDSQPAIS